MLNEVKLIGNVGSDPEARKVGDSTVVNFSFATSRSWKDKNGEKKTKTEWHQVVIWRKLAEIAEKYVKKGSKLHISGEINYESYEKDGVTKYSTKILCNNFIMLDNKGDTKQSNGPAEQPSPNPSNEPYTPLKVEDLPF